MPVHIRSDPRCCFGANQVLGSDMQIINIALDAQEKLVGEPGSMAFMQPSIKNSVSHRQKPRHSGQGIVPLPAAP